MIYNDYINDVSQIKVRKQDQREFRTAISHFTRYQFKKVFKRLLQYLLKKAKWDDSWYIEYKTKADSKSRYQVLSSMNEDKIKQSIDNYFGQEQEKLGGGSDIVDWYWINSDSW
jgi:hypothetical protein